MKKLQEERTFVLVKPDGVKRGLIGEIVHRFEQRGLKIIAMQEWLFEFLTSGPIVKMVVEGVHAVDMVRKICGNTLPNLADMGTLRGDYSVDSPALANAGKRAVHNIVHASENPAEAENEIKHWFKKDEIHSYKRAEEDIMF